MIYVLLAVAVVAEVVGTSLLSRTQGFTVLWPSLGSLASYAVAVVLLAHVVRTLPVGIAYAIWSGLGTLTVVAIGVTVLGQSLTAVQLAGVLLVVVGVVLLNLGGQLH